MTYVETMVKNNRPRQWERLIPGARERVTSIKILVTYGVPLQTKYPDGKIWSQKSKSVLKNKILVEMYKTLIRKVQIIDSKQYSLNQHALQSRNVKKNIEVEKKGENQVPFQCF